MKSGIQSDVLLGKLDSDSSRKVDQTMMKFVDGYIVGMILEITPETPQTVWNIHVEEDESYTANGHVVHNCLAIGVRNIGIGTIMPAYYREEFIPPEIRKLMEKEKDSGRGMSMRF